MNRKIYISGPMSNRPNWNKEGFAQAEAYLTALGYYVLNPHSLHDEPTETLEELKANGTWKETWQHYLKQDLQALIDCDELRVISDDWQESEGAKLEVYVAKRLGIPCYTLTGEPLDVCVPPLVFYPTIPTEMPDRDARRDPARPSP